MTKRTIRLKEYRPGSDQWCTPSEQYMEGTDGTLDSGPYRCRSDNDGFIKNGNKPATDATPIVFLGGSFVESLYSPEEDRFVAAAERFLIDKGFSIRLLNGGYSGSTTLQLLNVIINKIYPLVGPGGTLVLFGTHSDRDYLYSQGSYWSNTQRGTVILPAGDVSHENIPRGIGALDMVLRLLIITTKQLGLNLIIATAPYREGSYDSSPMFAKKYHGRRDWHHRGMVRRRQMVSLIRDVANETKTPLIDVQALLNGDPQYFYDELHLSPVGQAKVAQYVAETLAEHLGGLINHAGAAMETRDKSI